MAAALCLVAGASLAHGAGGGRGQDFLVSAYYSPLLGQSVYATGSYAGDIRLNGSGVAGADGTPVFVGMIAAPRSYAFGTRIFLPGFGVGSVHDRGGAIVAGAGYDRLDVWMGSGEAGLRRAQQFGLRMLRGLVLSADAPVRFSVSLLGGVAGADEVAGGGGTVATALETLGFLEEGADIRAAVLAFQLAAGVIADEADAGAGHVGPKTRAALAEQLAEHSRKEALRLAGLARHLRPTLSRGDSGQQVRLLRDVLGSFPGAGSVGTGEDFDADLEAAVLAFQLKNGVLQSADAGGAGVYGPRTRTALVDLLGKRVRSLEREKNRALATSVPPTTPLGVVGGGGAAAAPARAAEQVGQGGAAEVGEGAQQQAPPVRVRSGVFIP